MFAADDVNRERSDVGLRFRESALGLFFFMAWAASAMSGCGRDGVPAPHVQRRDLGQLVSMHVRNEPIFIGGYSDVDLTIDGASGLDYDDLRFHVVDPEAGFVSRSKDAFFDPDHPSFRIGAGVKTGTFVVEATNMAGDLVGSGSFSVKAEWESDEEGPPAVVWGINDRRDRTPNALEADDPSGPCYSQEWLSYGGGATKQVGIVFVDTDSKRFDMDQIETIAETWEQNVFSGLPERANPSAANYYREISAGQMSFTGRIVRHDDGKPLVVHLPRGWTSYFRYASAKGEWYAKEETPFSIVFDTLDEFGVGYFREFDVVMFVVQDDGDRFVWPTEYGLKSLFPIPGSFHPIFMPVETERHAGRAIYKSAAHELGHSLLREDLYDLPREMGPWDVMASDWDLPQFSMPNKIAMGWIDPAKVRCMRYQLGAEKDELVPLHPSAWAAERPAPMGYSAVEIRLGVRHSYFVEFRKAQDPLYFMSDQYLPMEPVHLISEAAGWGPSIYMAPDVGDGPVLKPGQMFQDPADPFALRLMSLQTFEMLVHQGTSARPEPSLRPWDSSFHSPDLFVRNARNWDGQRWINDEWMYDVFGDNPNRVVARVRNEGALDAPGVGVIFEYTIAGTNEAWKPIGSRIVRDIPQFDRRDFVSDEWIPDSGDVLPKKHYCVRARIVGANGLAPYSVPGSDPPIVEVSTKNDEARSNFQRMISKTASPSSREGQRILVDNSTDRARIMRIVLSQSNPLYRSYVEKAWVLLGPRESTEVLVGSEFVGTDPEGHILDEYRNQPNRLIVETYLTPEEFDSPQLVGGNQMEIVEGRAVEFIDAHAFVAGGEVRVEGGVREKSGGAVPPGGSIIFTIDRGGTLENRTVPLSGGMFGTNLPRTGWDDVRAYFVPPPGYADATSTRIQRP